MRDKLRVLLTDAHGFMEYRNKVYGLKYKWPKSKCLQCKYAFTLFRYNLNGYRDLVYYRVGLRCIKKLFKPTINCFLDVGEVEEGGCMFHHAFSTFINAEYIGKGCSFRNNTTIGNKISNGVLQRPRLEQHVFVGPNVVIIGGVTIGHHAVIGAGAVVSQDVPPYGVVVGNPARVIKINKPE